MTFTAVTTLRSGLAERRAMRAERERLARELAAYSSDADRLELDMILSRHSAADTALVEGILSRQAVASVYRLSA